MDAADTLLPRLVAWAEREEVVRALILEGSRAGGGLSDPLADFDVDVFTDAPSRFLANDGWLVEIGEVWVCIPEKYEWAGATISTRLVIFAGGAKVDFSFVPLSILAGPARHGDLHRGYLVLLDKDGLALDLPPPSFSGPRLPKPTEAEFSALVREFWFEAYHVPKFLRRGELWMAKFRDWSTKEFLLRMMEWHAQARAGWEADTYWLGKQMRGWASDETWEALHGAFGHFDADDSARALVATTALFRRLGRETAELLGYAYPEEVDRAIGGFIEGMLVAAPQGG